MTGCPPQAPPEPPPSERSPQEQVPSEQVAVTAAGPGGPRPAGWARRLLGYCLRHRRDLALAYGAAVVAALATAALPLVLRHVVDAVSADTAGSLTPWLVLLVSLGAVRFGASFTRRYRSGRVSLGVQYDLRNDAFASLVRLGGSKQDELRTGQAVSRSISDITLIQTLLQFLPNLTGNVLMFLASVVLMALLSPLLTAVALVVGPLLWMIAFRSRRDLFPANWHAQQEAAEVASAVEATVTGVRVVKGFGQEQRELAGLDGRARRLFASRMRVVRYTSRYNPALQAVPALGQVAVLALGGWMALDGRISLGTFLAFTTYLGSFVTPVRQLATLLTVWQPARAGAVRVMEVIDETPGPAETPDPVELPAEPPAVSWEDVTFAYGGGNPLLRGFSLDIRPGETVALIGLAGSGKSTAAALLPASTTWTAAASGSAATTFGSCPWTPCAPGSVSCSRSRSCSPTPSGPTSRTACRTPGTSGSVRRRGWPAPTSSSNGCRTATTRSWASRDSHSPADSGSGSPWPGLCSATRPCWSSTTPHRRSTRGWRRRSTTPCGRRRTGPRP